MKYTDIEMINGWLSFTDFKICEVLLKQQNYVSDLALAEIGVHHGKSFVALAAMSGGAKLYAIDIFDQQEKNIDLSGTGNLAAFKGNLKRFGIEEDRVVIDKNLSSDVAADDILNAVGPVRFFHIDGGHHYSAVSDDLKLATAVSSTESVIVLDDAFRAEWPEVSIAIFQSEALKESDFVMFAIGSNKAYFCHRSMVDRYQAVLLQDEEVAPFMSKNYSAKNLSIPVFQKFPEKHWGWIQFLDWYLSVWHPKTFLNSWQRLKSFKRAIKSFRD